MHYYRFNIGNYRKKTVHLTLLEHAIYRSLLDTYYMTENPLDSDTAKLMRSHSVRTAEEKEAFQNVIDEFFVLTDQGFTNEECEKQLKTVYDKSEKARASAKARWAKKECEEDPNAMQSQSERIENESERKENGCEQDADGMLPSTHIPSTQDNSMSFPKGKTCPQQEIVDLYHEILPELPRIVKWSSADQAQLRARWNEGEGHQSMEFWKAYFEAVRTSDWHMGKSNDWKANLRWLTKQANFNKMIERFVNDGTWS